MNLREIGYAVGVLLSWAVLSSCSGQEQTTSPPTTVVEKALPAETKILLTEPIPLQRVELAPEALTVWRTYAKHKPSLLILTDEVMIARVPNPLREESLHLAATGSREELARRSYPEGPNPLFLPEMTVGLALESGFFGGVYWALPFHASDQKLHLEPFLKEYQEKGLLDEKEAKTLWVDGKTLRGTVRGVPLTGAALPNLANLNGPVILHIDQSYFARLYKNDVSTPVLEMLYDTLRMLRDRKIPILAATFSYGNLDDRIAIDARFSAEILAGLLEDPALLDRAAPDNWKKHAQALYVQNFFRKDLAEELVLSMVKAQPESAWVRFAAYRALATMRKNREALGHLTRAVVLDRAYALEYPLLAKMAYKAGQKDEALRMLTLAVETFPENSALKFQQAQLCAEIGDLKTARVIVDGLRSQIWSPIYYPEMPQHLKNFSRLLDENIGKD